MSIKNDRWIRHMATKHELISPFTPFVHTKNVVSYGLSSFGYDVRAGFDWKLFTDVLGATVDPKHMDHRAYHDVHVLTDEEFAEQNGKDGGCSSRGNGVLIPPNSYALTHSIETLKVPRNVMAVCVGKSTYARCGIHVNVTPLEAGWEGQITIEISNGTRLPVRVYAGEGIMQILFFEGEDPDMSYVDRKGKYQHQKGITTAFVKGAEDPVFTAPVRTTVRTKKGKRASG